MITILINKEWHSNPIVVKDNGKVYPITPPFFSLKAYPQLRKRSIIVGLVGPRGSGKSVGGAKLTNLDYLLDGRKVWSNMDIGIALQLKNGLKELKSVPFDKLELVDLDEVYKNGLIFIDEVNIEIAEARRAMKQENIMFSYILQELRKRHLNIIWTAQNEGWVDDRLRFQTDILIKCKDVSPNNEPGQYSLWKAYDMSGMIREDLPHEKAKVPFYTGVSFNKPWWNSYNTWQLQGAERVAEEKEQDNSQIAELADQVANYVKDLGKVLVKEVKMQFNIYDSRIVRLLNVELLKRGVGSGAQGRYYEDLSKLARVD